MLNNKKSKLGMFGNRIFNIAFVCCVAIFLYLFLQLFFVASFKIPSDSMEPALLTGDYVLVDKCSKGARLFNVFDALEGKEVNIHRMPGWRNFRRNDVLIFNFPYPGRWDTIALDVMKYYVKRCIAVPGDTLEIRNAHYTVFGSRERLGNMAAQDDLLELIESGRAEEWNIVVKSYPDHECLDWTIAEFGPFYIPKKGSVLKMTPLNKLLYGNVIEWEQKEKMTLRRDTVLLGDSIIYDYRFLENYYFVSGDKMANSQDSRYWGLLPEPFIVGRTWCIWKSVDRNTDTVRWNRIFRRIK